MRKVVLGLGVVPVAVAIACVQAVTGNAAPSQDNNDQGRTLTIDGRAAVCTPAPADTDAQGSTPRSGGNLVVTVPRMTYVDERGATVRVWTNTGHAPNKVDQFAVLVPGSWHPASAGLVATVLAACGQGQDNNDQGQNQNG